MRISHLQAHQIIGMIDYPPLHSPCALREYYHSFLNGDTIPPVPVIPCSITLPYFMKFGQRFETYQHSIGLFFNEHPLAEYFQIDGKHRAAAATLAREKIPCIILETDHDITLFVGLQKEDSPIMGVDQTLEDSLKILEGHFYEHKRFWTVEEKNQSMIDHNDIPEDILHDLRKHI